VFFIVPTLFRPSFFDLIPAIEFRHVFFYLSRSDTLVFVCTYICACARFVYIQRRAFSNFHVTVVSRRCRRQIDDCGGQGFRKTRNI